MNLPLQLINDLQKFPEFRAADFLAAHEQQAATSVRLHPVKGIQLTPSAFRVPWCNNGYYLAERPVFTLDPLYHAGAYYVQEASSMFLEHVIKNLPSDNAPRRILDLCAAPGGKSTLIASLLQPEDLLISNEVIRSRATVLEENAVRWGYTNHWVICNDPRDIGKLTGYFDIIVVDAPCSGSGLFRKDKRALDEWTEDNVNVCSGRQKRILADAWPALKENGILIYSTCSFSCAEDEEILKWMHENFKVNNISIPIDDKWGIIKTESKGLDGYRFLPGHVAGEGFFIAVMQKAKSCEKLKFPRLPKPIKPNYGKSLEDLINLDNLLFIENKGFIEAIYSYHANDLALLKQLFYLRKTGLAVGQPGSKEWIPDHALALSIDLKPGVPALALTLEQALKYLKREDPGIQDAARGWKIVTYNNLPLGWVKCLGNRINNNLPKHWKIRMDIPDTDAG